VSRIVVDYAVCVGHGQCYSLAPTLFEPDDDGRTKPLVEEVPPGDARQAAAVVQCCPAEALSLDSGQDEQTVRSEA
jgi:ferredoxin